jgi:hypothetical protein
MSQRGKVGLMFFFFAVCAMAALATYKEQRQLPPARPVDLYSVVHSQFQAFRAADFPRAYQHASAGIQEKFSVGQFEQMVRIDYAAIIEAERVEFGATEVRGRHAIVQAFFVGEDGGLTPCIYSLVNEGELWKIEGARVLRRIPRGERLDRTRV